MQPHALFILALSLGLTGGFSHCIGMCGIFVVSYAGAPTPNSSGRHVWQMDRHLLYHGGRLATLACLGLIGGALGNLTHRWADAQGAIAIAAGVLLVLLALGFSEIVPRFRYPEPDVMGAGGGFLRRQFGRALRSQSKLRPLFIGAFVGLLPCGLTYQALIPAALNGRPIVSAATMILFGLGTIPGLLTLGLFGGAAGRRLFQNTAFRTRMTRISALIMAVMGFAFLWRGIEQFIV